MTHSVDADTSPLVALGLTPYGARVYLALARSWPATAQQVADSARVPRQRVYDVLGDLTARGLAVRRAGRPHRFDAVDPERAMARLMTENRRNLTMQQTMADEISTTLRAAWLRAKGDAPQAPGADATGQVTLVDVGRWGDLARHSILATTHAPFEGTEDPSWLLHVERLTSTGGTVRCIYQRDVLAEPRLLTRVRLFAAAGEQARVADKVPTRMILADGCRALLPVPSAGVASTGEALLIEHDNVVTRLEEDFEQAWNLASPLPRGVA